MTALGFIIFSVGAYWYWLSKASHFVASWKQAAIAGMLVIGAGLAVVGIAIWLWRVMP